MTTASPTATTSGNRTNSGGELRGLTGLRAVAALWVVLFHFHFTPLPGVAAVVDVLGPLVTAGALGVDLFFVLSGFVIAHTYLDQLGPALRLRATAQFVWARAARLWPLYAVVLHLFGAWLLVRAHLGADGEIAFQAVQPVLDVGQYVQQLFLVQLWDDPFFDGASWVGSTWSVSAEWLAYLLFPALALVLHRMRRVPAVLLAVGAVALMAPMGWAYLSSGSPYFPWSWVVRILCGFGAGALVHLAVRRLPTTEGLRWSASALAAVLPGLIAAGLLFGELTGPGRGGAVIVLFPLLVAALALADRGPAAVLCTRLPVYGGRLSYGLYLVHIPLFEVYWLALRRFSWPASHTVLAHVVGLLVVVASVAAAALGYHLVEEPARRRLRAARPVVGRLAQRVAARAGVRRSRCAPAPQPAGHGAVARFTARRRSRTDPAELAEAGRYAPRHAASSTRSATLAAALVEGERRRTAHRGTRDPWTDQRRAEFARIAHLHAGR